MKGKNHMENIEKYVALTTGFVVSIVSLSLDVVGLAVTVLFGLMAIDMLTGIMIAFSNKELDYQRGLKGLFKKCYILLIILALWFLSALIDVEFEIASGVASAFAVMEFISIIQNGKKLDIVMPQKLKQYLEILTGKVTK